MSPRFATYLDSNAGAPLRAEVREALARALERELIPNPSSIHAYGREARKLLNDARERVARSFGSSHHSAFPTDQITFTSSGTEASQLAIRSALEPAFLRGEKPHWITTPVEHDATLRMIDWTKERGGSVSVLPVDSNGSPDASALSELVTPATRLISAIWVNNETGVVSDVEALSDQASRAQIPLHLDGAQAWGKIPVNLSTGSATCVSFSGHKIGALSGTGILWKKKSAMALSPSILGTQEGAARGGTENLAGLISLGAAASYVDPVQWDARVRPVRERIEKEILAHIPNAKINGAGAPRVANTLSLSFEGIERSGLVPALDLAGFAVSSGSACSSGVDEPSHVLMAMGHSRGLASASIRVSLYDEIPLETQNQLIEALSACVERLRKHA